MCQINCQVSIQVTLQIILQLDIQQVLPASFQLTRKVQIPDHQSRYPRGTSKSANKYNTTDPSYNLIFFLKSKSHTYMPTGESENIPHLGKCIVLLDS